LRKLDRFPVTASRSRYPWDQLLDGDLWELIYGEDFAAKPNTVHAREGCPVLSRLGPLS
jgi:hypothetical protein